jgi:hypothetical protein
MAQVRIEPLHVLVLPGREIPETAPRLAADGGPYTQRGSTQHFNVYYEDSLGTNGPTLADAVLASCENDYTSLQDYFGGITPGGLPFSIYVVSGNFGAYHASCAATECHCAVFAGTDANLVRMLVVAEEDEVFMANQNVGWDCGASNGEGLSRVLDPLLELVTLSTELQLKWNHSCRRTYPCQDLHKPDRQNRCLDPF